VCSYGLRTDEKGKILIPLYDINGKIHGLQLIDSEGDKKFITGTVKMEHFFPIYGENDVLYICEGYATGATIYNITGKTTFCALDSGNLKSVAKVLRKKYPFKKIVIAGDNDLMTKENPGKTKAKEAGNESICYVA
jgi:putative DNA primase/helicase